MRTFSKGDILQIRPKSEFEYTTHTVYVFDGTSWEGQNDNEGSSQRHFSYAEIEYIAEKIYDDRQNMDDMIEMPTNSIYRNNLKIYAYKDQLRIWQMHGNGQQLVRKGSKPMKCRLIHYLEGEIELDKRRLVNLESLLKETQS